MFGFYFSCNRLAIRNIRTSSIGSVCCEHPVGMITWTIHFIALCVYYSKYLTKNRYQVRLGVIFKL